MSRMALIRSLVVASTLTLLACKEQAVDPSAQYGANPTLPEPQQYLLPPMKVLPAIGWNAQEKPVVPGGLEVKAFATGFQHPRIVYPLPNGDVLVVESNAPTAPIYRPKDYIEGKIKALSGSGATGGNRITLLRDKDSDGVSHMRSVFIDHLNSPYGIVLVGNALYVADTDKLLRFAYTPGATQIMEPGVTLTDLPAQSPNHHWTKALTSSPDGTKLYVGVGSNSNITENGIGAEEGRAMIWEIDRTTGMKRSYASGTRNPTGLAFEPASAKLWAIVNERDEIGPDLVPDYLTAVQENAFYGWPYSYWGQHVDIRVQPQRPELVAQAVRPDYGLGSHVAPLGLVFSQGDNLPAQYRSGVFIGEHGSWDRDPPVGYKVVYIPFSDGRPNGPPQDVVTGFISNDGKTRGRPVGVAIDRTGGILIADDVGNTIWRVTAASSTTSPAASP
jgi:glucose/arabinose dehydrogenase